MINLRCRFRVNKIAEVFGGGIEVQFSAMYDDKIAEDMRFMKATPWGDFTMRIDNPFAIAQLKNEDGSWKLGQYVYVDLKDAPAY